MSDDELMTQISELERCLDTMKSMLKPMPSTAILSDAAHDGTVPTGEAEVSERGVRQLLKRRLRRERYFGPGIFSDPAWDMLLELFACELGGTSVSVSSLCIASNVPGTTALRHIKRLEQDGWVKRRFDPRDARRTWIELSSKGSNTIRQYAHNEWPTVASN